MRPTAGRKLIDTNILNHLSEEVALASRNSSSCRYREGVQSDVHFTKRFQMEAMGLAFVQLEGLLLNRPDSTSPCNQNGSGLPKSMPFS